MLCADLAQYQIESQLASYNAYQDEPNLSWDPEFGWDYSQPLGGRGALATGEGKKNSNELEGGLFEASLRRIEEALVEDVDQGIELIEGLENGRLKDAIITSPRIPFKLLLKSVVKLGAEQVTYLDDWILANEHHIRRYIRHHPTTWPKFLLSLSSLYSILSDSPSSISDINPTHHTMTLHHPSSSALPGFSILDRKSPSSRTLHSDLSSFKKTWDRMTGNILKGLDWNNVCVAGGFPLVVLQNHTRSSEDGQKEADKKLLDSDLDLYLVNLPNSRSLNSKLHHIESIYRSNLPSGQKMLVTQNSRTVTFFSDYPTRRVQVVLKSCKSLAEVLLNFDLDQCAVAFDGEEVWMLPRAVRALQTSYSTFTMTMPHGHWLNDRRETQEQRVFKYANRGFGIRFLPSYLSALDPDFNIEYVANKSRAKFGWIFRRLVRNYGWNKMPKDRNETDFLQKNDLYKKIPDLRVPVVTHAIIEQREVNGSSEQLQERSCLSCFEHLMRHVALWELECDGKVIIDESVWASDSYTRLEGISSYDDCPRYEWNDKFTLEEFKVAIDRYNKEEWGNFLVNLEDLYHTASESDEYEDSTSPFFISPLTDLRRMSYGATLEDVFSKPVLLLLVLPKSFYQYAKELVGKVIVEEGLDKNEDHSSRTNNLADQWLKKALKPGMARELVFDDPEDSEMYSWTIPKELMWQRLSRTIDEVFEMLWAFFRANSNIGHNSVKVEMFERSARRRAAKPPRTAATEKASFSIWMETAAPNIVNGYSFSISQGFWNNDDDEFEIFYKSKPPEDHELDMAGKDWRPSWDGLNGLKEDGNYR